MGRLPDQIERQRRRWSTACASSSSRSRCSSAANRIGCRCVESQIDEMRQGAGRRGMTVDAAPPAIQAAQTRIDASAAAARPGPRARLHRQAPGHRRAAGGDRRRRARELTGVDSQSRGEPRRAAAGRSDLPAEDPGARRGAAAHPTLQRADRRRRSAQIGAYQSRVEAAPMVEQELCVAVSATSTSSGRATRT